MSENRQGSVPSLRPWRALTGGVGRMQGNTVAGLGSLAPGWSSAGAALALTTGPSTSAPAPGHGALLTEWFCLPVTTDTELPPIPWSSGQPWSSSCPEHIDVPAVDSPCSGWLHPSSHPRSQKLPTSSFSKNSFHPSEVLAIKAGPEPPSSPDLINQHGLWVCSDTTPGILMPGIHS